MKFILSEVEGDKLSYILHFNDFNIFPSLLLSADASEVLLLSSIRAS